MNKLECTNIIYGLPPELTENDTVAMDLELSGLKDGSLHRPNGKLECLTASYDGETAYIIFEPDEVPEFLKRVEKATWVFHNSTFDLAHMRRWALISERKKMRDTMIIEKLMFSNYYDSFKLNDLVRRYLHMYMSKDVRKDFSTHEGKMTNEEITYACTDAISTWLVDREQQNIIDEQDMAVWKAIDLPTVWTSLDLSGFAFDTEEWLNNAKHYQKTIDKVEAELGQKYGKNVTTVKKKKVTKLQKLAGESRDYIETYSEEFVPFKPSSTAQVLELLKSEGVPVESTGEDVLRPYIDKFEIVKTVAEYRIAQKKVDSYGKSFLRFVEDDGKIHAELIVTGAETGRSACRNPPLQTIPKEKEYRKCFIAGKGKKLVIADYSAQEPRIFAYLTQDQGLIDILVSGKDIYIEVARMAFNETITKKDKDRRNTIKALVLGLAYGLTPYGFARDNEVDIETAEDMYNAFFKAFPMAEKFVKDKQATNSKITRTILGRKCHLHPYSNQWKNNTLNNPMQGGGADMTKLAMKEFRKRNKQLLHDGVCGIILPVHDEIILWCLEEIAPNIEKELEECMISVAEKIHVGIPAVVEIASVDNWSQKK